MIACLRLTADVGEERQLSPTLTKVLHLTTAFSDAGRTDQMAWEGILQHRPLFPDDCIVSLCLSSRHTQSHTCSVSSEDKNLCCSPEWWLAF